MAKNAGPQLVDKIRGTLEVLPAWVRRYVKYTITKQKVDAKTPVDPDVLTGGKVASELRQEVTDERLKLNTELDPAALPATRTGQQVLPNGQVATTTETVDDAPQSLVESATLEDGSVENVGDISMLQKVEALSVLGLALFSKERVESLPAKFRVAFPVETTRLDSAGTPVMPTLGAGDVSKTEEQTRVGVKRATTTTRSGSITPPTTPLPGSVVTSEFGGDVATVQENIVVDTTVAVGGENVISDEVEALGDGNATRRRLTRTAGAWPELTAYEADPRSQTVFAIRKKYVDATTVVAPTINGLIMTEFKEYDRWKSIQIVTSIPSSILSQVVTRSITANRPFPMQVDRCEYVTAVKRTNFTVPETGNIANEVSSFDIALDVAYIGGYSGIVEARIIETFTTNPQEALPPIFKYFTVGGTLCLGYTMSGVAVSGASVRTFSLRDSLHPTLNPAPPSIVNFGSGAQIVGTLTYSAVTWDPSDGIPASEPTALNVGQWIVDDVDLELWRCGVYVKSVLEVKVPDFI